MMVLLSRSHTKRSPDCPPHSTELPSQQKHLHAHGTSQQVLNSNGVCRSSPCAPHLCSSSAFTDDITIPVWTSVTFMQESAPTLRTCRLSEVVKKQRRDSGYLPQFVLHLVKFSFGLLQQRCRFDTGNTFPDLTGLQGQTQRRQRHV